MAIGSIYFCFFLSGVTALIYEIAWQKLLTRLLGSSLYALATITAVFLAGLAIGAVIGGWQLSRSAGDSTGLKEGPEPIAADKSGSGGDKTRQVNGGVAVGRQRQLTSSARDIAMYGTLELAVAICALGLPYLFDSALLSALFAQLQLPSAELGGGWPSVLIRGCLASAAMLPPTILMGATFPVLVRGCRTLTASSEFAAEVLYALNTSGAFLGCLLAGFVLLPNIGLMHTCMFAAAVNLIAAGTAIYTAFRISSAPRDAMSSSELLRPVTISHQTPALDLAADSMAAGIHREAAGSDFGTAPQPVRLPHLQPDDKDAAGPESGPESVPAPAPAPQAQRRKKSRDEQILTFKSGLFVALVAGAISLSLEISWSRWFQLLVGSSGYSVALVLSMVLAGLASGSMFVACLLRKLKQPILLMATAAAVSAVYIIVSLYAADEMPWTVIWLTQVFGGADATPGFGQAILVRIMIVALNIYFPCLCMGTIVPLLFQTIEASVGAYPWRAAAIYAANTGGVILGALGTGFLLIPILSPLAGSGIQASLLIAVSAQVLLSFYLFCCWSCNFIDDGETRMAVNGFVAFMALAVIADLVWLRPSWNQVLMSAGGVFYGPREVATLDRETFLSGLGLSSDSPQKAPDNLKFYREGLNSTVTVETNKSNIVFLKSDGRMQAAMPEDPALLAPGTDLPTHASLGYLPVLLHKGQCQNALVIGFGSGTTCGAMADFPEIKHIDVCELEPAVIDADRFFEPTNGRPLRSEWISDGRTACIVNDGRYVLMSDPKQYDAIVSQPADPWVNGSSELFSREFWQLARARLAKNGVFCQWVQLYSLSPEYFGIICRTFRDIFPSAILVHQAGAGECVLMGFTDEANADASVIQDRLNKAGRSGVLKMAGVSSSSDVLSAVRLDSAGLKSMCSQIAAETNDSRLNTDDNLIIEYAAARNALTKPASIQPNIDWIKRYINSSEHVQRSTTPLQEHS